jgi:hypothetical protein
MALQIANDWDRSFRNRVGGYFSDQTSMLIARPSHIIIGLSQVDIELPEDLPLKEAHAIGESLQIKIEELPEVERAFVHLDFECDHKPEHSILSKLPSSQP